MTDYGLVIGCDSYPNQPNADLTSAVRDALAVRDWLLSDRGERVGAVTFLASPSPIGLTTDGPASRARFAEAVAEVVERRDVGEADRLFVFFAGHGCATDPVNPMLSRDALVLTDYSDRDPAGGCVGVDDLLRRLELSGFGAVLVWLDMCREHPFRTSFDLARLGVDPPNPRRPHRPDMYLAQATRRGETAAGQPGVGGYFTKALLAGLRGDGRAKVFDETEDIPYLVRWSTLREYLTRTLAPQGQRPTLTGDGEIVLARFPEETFPEVSLTINVDPMAARTNPDLKMEVTYPVPNAPRDEVRKLPGPAPVELSVPQRRHQILVEVNDRWNRKWLDVYRDEQVRLRLRNPLLEDVPPSELPQFRSPLKARSALIRVVADDPAAVIRLRDSRGRVILTDVGQIDGRLPPDLYYAILATPYGLDVVESVEVDVWRTRSVRLAAPNPSDKFRSSLMAADGLQWASGAALAAADVMAATKHLPSGEPVIGIYGTEHLPVAGPASTHTQHGAARAGVLGQWRHHDVPQGWAVHLTGLPAPAEVGIAIGDHVLVVPTMRGVATGVFFGERELTVGLYDRHLANRPNGLLLLDRAQQFLSGDLRGGAQAVLRRLGREAPNSSLLPILVSLTFDTELRNNSPGLLAMDATPIDRHQLLEGPWNVRLARRATGPHT